MLEFHPLRQTFVIGIPLMEGRSSLDVIRKQIAEFERLVGLG